MGIEVLPINGKEPKPGKLEMVASGETYPKTLSSDETFVVPDKFLRKY